MAKKRMMTQQVTDSDEFISLSSSAQALYMHLTLGSDDDGFNNQVQMAMFKAHASVDDLKVLMAKRFVIQFECGVIVIKHWRMANAIRKDRYTPTVFQEELRMLGIKENGAYTMSKQYKEVASNLTDVISRWEEAGYSREKILWAIDMLKESDVNDTNIAKCLNVIENDDIANKEGYVYEMKTNGAFA